jgi:hypothetical protein
VSTTRPEIVPVVLCACATPAVASTATTSQIPNLIQRIEILPTSLSVLAGESMTYACAVICPEFRLVAMETS